MTGPDPAWSGVGMWHVMLFYFLLAGSSAYALWKGGAPERIAAVIILLATLFTLLVAPDKSWVFGSVHAGIFLVDLSMFVALVALALHADRFWPLWMSAMQGFGVFGHISVWLAPSIKPVVYAATHAIASYPILILLAFATYRHLRRVSANGADPSWAEPSYAPMRAGA
ncbi:hypothetical protein [Sphingomonas sp. KR3-1]|uniref:hypothetical protein n=1 Tax=Sphingomonas sp. KR3-1 TaxID=3156611 RepID=UPI0032B5D266